MYFFSLKKLKADLIEKPLTERVSLPYLIGTELAYAVAVEIGTIPPEASYATSYNLWNVADSVISILATVWEFCGYTTKIKVTLVAIFYNVS